MAPERSTGTIEEVVTTFLVEHGFIPSDDDPLLAGDLSDSLDSIALMSLVGFLEDTYDFQVPDEDITPEHLLSLAGIAAYVRTRVTER